mgnify:CR=1 FL=1
MFVKSVHVEEHASFSGNLWIFSVAYSIVQLQFSITQ